MRVEHLTDETTGKQAELTRKLLKASIAYYGTGFAIMSDLEFDQLQEELLELERESGFAYEGSPNVSVGATVVTELLTQKHSQETLSLDKVKYKDKENLKNWLSDKMGLLSWKMDGLTIVSTYENGTLINSVTRGDGVEGSVVTHNAIFFNGLPIHIPFKEKLVVRGEAVMTYDEFDRVNEEAGGIYENPRNLAAATVQMLNAAESKKRSIEFYAFKLVEPMPFDGNLSITSGMTYNAALESDRFKFLEALGFQVVPHDYASMDTILDKIDAFQGEIKTNPFPTDGLVLSYNDQIYAESLGNTNKHPRGSIAMKWTDETATTTIRDIFWSVGKTGQITPVAVFDPVRLGVGSTITRASLHNLSILQNIPFTDDTAYKIKADIGSTVEVYLANMIIPQIASVKPGNEAIIIPDKCPVCGEPTHIVENNGVRVLYCSNTNCPARTKGMLQNAFCKDGLNVKGLGPSQIEDLQRAGMLSVYPVDVFEFRKCYGDTLPSALSSIDGWGNKSWLNLLNAIDKARNTTLKRFLYSLGVPMLGNDLSKKLEKYWDGDIQKFIDFVKNPDLDALTELDGVGPVKAQHLIDWCNAIGGNEFDMTMLTNLVAQLNFPEPQEKRNDVNTLSGIVFVITGTVHEYKNRDEFKASVEARGGKISGSVSKNTNYLVNNDVSSTSGKNKKAKELNIPIISEDEFISKFGK